MREPGASAMSEMRASRNPVSSNTALAASSSRARVCAPLRERAFAGGASADSVRGMLASVGDIDVGVERTGRASWGSWICRAPAPPRKSEPPQAAG